MISLVSTDQGDACLMFGAHTARDAQSPVERSEELAEQTNKKKY